MRRLRDEFRDFIAWGIFFLGFMGFLGVLLSASGDGGNFEFPNPSNQHIFLLVASANTMLVGIGIKTRWDAWVD